MTVVLGFLALALTVLGVAVGYMAWRNGKVIRENTDRMLQVQEKILREIKESTEKILQSQKESTEKILNEIKEINKNQRLGFRMICLMILAKDEDERKMYAKKLLEEI